MRWAADERARGVGLASRLDSAACGSVMLTSLSTRIAAPCTSATPSKSSTRAIVVAKRKLWMRTMVDTYGAGERSVA